VSDLTSAKALGDWLANKGFPLLSTVNIQNDFQPAIVVGNLAFVASATPMREDGTELVGKVGCDIDLILAQEAACLCVAHSLSLLQETIGSPIEERLTGVVDLTFFINADPSFNGHSTIADAGSRLLIDGLGAIGGHARSAIGAGSLVRNVSVVLKAVYRVVPLSSDS